MSVSDSIKKLWLRFKPLREVSELLGWFVSLWGLVSTTSVAVTGGYLVELPPAGKILFGTLLFLLLQFSLFFIAKRKALKEQNSMNAAHAKWQTQSVPVEVAISEAYHYIESESLLSRDPLKEGQHWARELLDSAVRRGQVDASGIPILNDPGTLETVFSAPGPPKLNLSGNRVAIPRSEWDRIQIPLLSDIRCRQPFADRPHATRHRGGESRATCYAYVQVNMNQVQQIWPRPEDRSAKIIDRPIK